MRPAMPFARPFALPALLAATGLLLITACGQEIPDPPHVPPADSAETLPAEPAGPVFDVEALGIPMDEASIADGKAIAETHCAICHGLDQDTSLRGDAPPLRYVLSLYSPENLGEDFRAGIHVGHEDMPDFVFGDLGMDVLLAYLVSIQETPALEE
ncbi:MAG: c-type cytochrome [Hyphomonas sp.]